MTVSCVVMAAVVKRLVCLERREAVKEVKMKLPTSFKSFLNYVDLKNRNRSLPSHHPFSKFINETAEKVKKHRIHSETLNDICLLIYVGGVSFSCLVFFIVMTVGIDRQVANLPLRTTDIQHFKPTI